MHIMFFPFVREKVHFFKKIMYISFECKTTSYIYFWPPWVFVAVCRPSLVAANKGATLGVVFQLLVALASLVVEHGF